MAFENIEQIKQHPIKFGKFTGMTVGELFEDHQHYCLWLLKELEKGPSKNVEFTKVAKMVEALMDAAAGETPNLEDVNNPPKAKPNKTLKKLPKGGSNKYAVDYEAKKVASAKTPVRYEFRWISDIVAEGVASQYLIKDDDQLLQFQNMVAHWKKSMVDHFVVLRRTDEGTELEKYISKADFDDKKGRF